MKAADAQVWMAVSVLVTVAIVVVKVCVNGYTVVGGGDAFTRRQEQALLRRAEGASAPKLTVGARFRMTVDTNFVSTAVAVASRLERQCQWQLYAAEGFLRDCRGGRDSGTNVSGAKL